MIRILIWAPHEILQAGLKSALSEESDVELLGFVVSAAEAMEALKRLEPDVLLLDEFCDRDVIQAACNADVNTIVFSSSSAPADIVDALNAGVNAYILKDTSAGLLVSAIRAVAAGASWLDPIIAKRTLQAIADGRGLRACTEVKRQSYTTRN
ncbi:MAG: response regulator transcription factor [Candidatus Obscuribacterales bacterium]|nr:response regulator transcription factor [Candidatus Obscuribacterales bacterium]